MQMARTDASIAARLDRLPSSRTVWTIVLLISLGCVFEFYDLFFTAYVAPGMVDGGLFTAQSLGIFASLKIIRVAGFGTFVFSTFAGLWFGVVTMVALLLAIPVDRRRIASAAKRCSPGRSSGTAPAPRSWRFSARGNGSTSGASLPDWASAYSS